jgi:hypothetical protein
MTVLTDEIQDTYSVVEGGGDGVNKKREGGGLYRNTITYLGGLIILVSVMLILLFLLLSFSLQPPSPYLGILTYMIFPGFLVLGMLVFLYGLFRESRRRRRLGAKEALPYPKLDLNDSRQGNTPQSLALPVMCPIRGQ